MFGELETHIEVQEEPDRKNGNRRKQDKIPVGNVEIDIRATAMKPSKPELLPCRKNSRVDPDRQIIAL